MERDANRMTRLGVNDMGIGERHLAGGLSTSLTRPLIRSGSTYVMCVLMGSLKLHDGAKVTGVCRLSAH